MTYPKQVTINNLNQEDLDWNIKWPGYLGQTFAPGAVPFVPIEGASTNFLYNNADSLFALSPYLRGAAIPKHPVDTTLVSEPFQRFGDASVLDCADIVMENGVDSLEQQVRSIEARILRELNNQFFTGNGVAPNLRGIGPRADTTIAVGGPITLSFLYQARYSINPSHENGLGWGGNAWFSHANAFRKVLELFGTRASQIEWKMHPFLKVQIPYVLGMPWYIDENIPITGGRTTIYAVNLNHLCVLYATHPDYCANKYGLIRIPIPVQASISEFGKLILGIYAIQNDPGAIVRLTTVAV